MCRRFDLVLGEKVSFLVRASVASFRRASAGIVMIVLWLSVMGLPAAVLGEAIVVLFCRFRSAVC